MTDLSNLSIGELRELQNKVKSEIATREKDEIARVQQEIARLAQSVGMTPMELLNLNGAGGKKQGKSVNKPVAARYQNPADATQQWTGRGRKPKWVIEYLENSGKDLESLSIQ